MKIVIVVNDKTFSLQMNQKEQNKMAALLRSNDNFNAVSSLNEDTIFVDLDSYMTQKYEVVEEHLSAARETLEHLSAARESLEHLSAAREILEQQEAFCSNIAEILKKIRK